MTSSYRDITLVELEILWELSQQGSLRSLGRAKGLQASHVSKILSRIEKKLGTSVVQRSAKGIVLTPDGIRLVSVARTVVENARELSPQTETGASTCAPLVTVAAARFIASGLLAPALDAVRERGSIFRFRLLDMSPDQIAPATFKSVCEIAVVVGTPNLSAAWETKKLGLLSWGLFASRFHPLTGVASQREVLVYPFVVPNYWTGDGFETGNDSCPVPWEKRVRGDETSAISAGLEIIRQSPRQLVFAPRLVASPFALRGELKEIQVREWPRVTRPVSLAVRADRVSQALYRNLTAELKQRLV
jgi:DNA-binding transcriptional LysR family regulator